MYKVFINEHLIRLQSEKPNLDDGKSHLALFDPSQEELRILVEGLFREHDQLDVEIISDHPGELWALFQSTFKIIKAAGGVVRNQNGEKLLIKRLDKWDLPKGKMEQGESPQETAIREVEEECSLSSLKIIDQLQSTYHMYMLGDEMILKKTFWFNMEAKGDISVRPQTEEGITEVKWFAENDLAKAREQTYRSLIALI